MDKPLDRPTDRLTDGPTDRPMDGPMDGQLDGPMDGQMDVQTDGRIDGWTDKPSYKRCEDASKKEVDRIDDITIRNTVIVFNNIFFGIFRCGYASL